MLSKNYILRYKNGRDLYRYHGDSCVGIGEVTTGRSERRRNHKVDAISQCKEPEGVSRTNILEKHMRNWKDSARTRRNVWSMRRD